MKTENILLDKRHVIKIADFGVARILPKTLNEMTGNTGPPPPPSNCSLQLSGIRVLQIPRSLSRISPNFLLPLLGLPAGTIGYMAPEVRLVAPE